jgi:Zn-dependent M28 family amino/carboxypeptidase
MEGSPGGGDNLLSTVICMKITEIFGQKNGLLKHTRLILLSTDGEEIDQKGAQAFIEHHGFLLKQTKNYVFNMDSIYKYRELAILRSDRNGTIRLSDSLASGLKSLSDRLGYSFRTKKFIFGGGGTDAAQFAKIGVETASLIGISTNLIRSDLSYHTSEDVVKNVEPKAVEAVLNLAVQFILSKDKEISGPGQKQSSV